MGGLRKYQQALLRPGRSVKEKDSWDMRSNRSRQGAKSRAQLEAEVAKEKYEEKLAEIEAQQEGSDLVAIAKKRKLPQGKRFLP